MHDDAGGGPGPDDETRPFFFERPLATDPEPVVAEALAVIERTVHAMVTYPTRPLLDPPPLPFRLRPLGASGLSVFPVVLDTAPLATAPDRVTVHRVLDAYAALGGNALVVEDAPDGRGAQTVGTWLANRRRREATVLAGRIGSGGLAAADLASAARRLLRRLGTERLDLLIITGHDARVPFEETLIALAGLVEQDRVGHIAAGGLPAARLIQARVAAGQRALPLLEAVAPVYNLLERDPYEREIAPVVHAQGLACLPSSPLADGLLAGSAPTRGWLRRLREEDPVRAERVQPLLTRRTARVLEAVSRIAAEREVPGAAVALAWLLTRPHVTAPVVAASSLEQVWAAGAAASVHLSRSEASALDRAGE